MNSTINCSHHVIHQIARPYSPQRGKFVFLPTSLYFPHSQLLATIFLLSVFMSLMGFFFSFFRLHIQLIDTMQYLSFLSYFTQHLALEVHPRCGKQQCFFLMAEKCSIVYIQHIFFIRSSSNEHRYVFSIFGLL